ncbi:MAG TPA: oligoendopeptidase F [Pirellulaceae bacterium]|nr:oligoendopeptidase F [Pirellulaceae bacterium]
MNEIQRLPKRSEVPLNHTWDLSGLFASEQEWEESLQLYEGQIAGYAKFKGRLGEGAALLAECLAFDSQLDQLAERLGSYAFLRTSEDQANSHYQRMVGRFQAIATRAGEASSYMRPEILAMPQEQLERYLESAELKHYRLLLERLVRYKPHTLSNDEERLLAMQAEMSDATNKIFRQLLDADMKFGLVTDENGCQIELSSATLMQLMISPSREVRKTAFHQFYQQFSAHQNTLAATLNGSVQRDVYYARVRNYSSALSKALFADDVPIDVYENLIGAVRANLPTLHRYYELRRDKMGLPDIHHYDTYVPIISDIKSNHSWEDAVGIVFESLAVLGPEYCNTLKKGLLARWCDRYPNEGKQSGAFSAGGYTGDPYILMNYKPTVLNDLFTLTHEAGHSMHTYLSAQHQPYEYYNYTIFVAEVASTFNEQLLSNYLIQHAKDNRERAYLINNQIDDIRSTLIRQTMFAEFEKIIHASIEAGEPLTIEVLKDMYGQLLHAYFGPNFTIDEELKLECLRIPHFYRAFYVYKYATGLSAAIALSERVLQGGKTELNRYLNFLKSGCSKYPLELLKDAGVDLTSPEPVDTALKKFDSLVNELQSLI